MTVIASEISVWGLKAHSPFEAYFYSIIMIIIGGALTLFLIGIPILIAGIKFARMGMRWRKSKSLVLHSTLPDKYIDLTGKELEEIFDAKMQELARGIDHDRIELISLVQHAYIRSSDDFTYSKKMSEVLLALDYTVHLGYLGYALSFFDDHLTPLLQIMDKNHGIYKIAYTARKIMLLLILIEDERAFQSYQDLRSVLHHHNTNHRFTQPGISFLGCHTDIIDEMFPLHYSLRLDYLAENIMNCYLMFQNEADPK